MGLGSSVAMSSVTAACWLHLATSACNPIDAVVAYCANSSSGHLACVCLQPFRNEGVCIDRFSRATVGQMTEEDVVVASSSMECATPTRPPAPNMNSSPMSFGTWDPAELSPLARRVPQYKKSSNTLEDTLRKQQHAMLVHIVDVLSKNDQLISPLDSHMVLLMKEMATKSGDDEWASVSTMAKLDEDWILQWLEHHSNLTLEELSASKIADPMSFQHLLTFGLQLPAQVKLAPEMKFKPVCWAVLASRHEQVGNRLRTLDSTCISASGAIRWAKGCYSLCFDHGQANLIKHVTGASVALPPYVVINSEFTIENNYDDKAASATLGAASYLLQNFFGVGVGPNRYPRWSPKSSLLADLARVEFAKYQATKAESGNSSATQRSAVVLQAATKQKQSAAASTARDVLVIKSAKLKTQRLVTLTT